MIIHTTDKSNNARLHSTAFTRNIKKSTSEAELIAQTA